MFLVLWGLVGAGMGAGYFKIRPGRERLATPVIRGIVGGVLGGFLLPRFTDAEVLPLAVSGAVGAVGAILLAAVAVAAVDIYRRIRSSVQEWQRSQA